MASCPFPWYKHAHNVYFKKSSITGCGLKKCTEVCCIFFLSGDTETYIPLGVQLIVIASIMIRKCCVWHIHSIYVEYNLALSYTISQGWFYVYFLVPIYVSLCVYVHVSAVVPEGQKRELDPLRLESQKIVSHLMRSLWICSKHS